MIEAQLTETESQLNAIRKHLKSGKSLTQISALSMFGCFRLGARIHNLREEGMEIETEMVKQGRKRFARYFVKDA